MDWLDVPVLVTGATGLVGSHLCKALRQRGANVIALVRDNVPRSLFWDDWLSYTIVRGDVRDLPLLRRVINEYDVQIAYHLAAATQVVQCSDLPYGALDVNVLGTAALLEAARTARVKVIVASSDKAYGDAKPPYREDTPLQGRNPYDVSKSCADLIAQMYREHYKMPVAIARCGNIFGEGDMNWQRIIPGLMRAIIRKQMFRIRSNGGLMRDYIYVGDVVDAYLALADADGPYNFGYENPLTVVQLVELVYDILGIPRNYYIADTAHGEIETQWLDCTRARDELGWVNPTYGIETAIERTFEWYRTALS